MVYIVINKGGEINALVLVLNLTTEHFTMKQTNHQTISLSATYLSLSTYDNELEIHDESGDKVTLKGFTTDQLDSLCSGWLRDRLRKDESLKDNYSFARLNQYFTETASV